MRSKGAPHRWALPSLAVAHAAASGGGHAGTEGGGGRGEDGEREFRVGGVGVGSWKGPAKRRQCGLCPRTLQRRCQTQGPAQWGGAPSRGTTTRACHAPRRLGALARGGRPVCYLRLGTAWGGQLAEHGCSRPRGGARRHPAPVSVPPGPPVTLGRQREGGARGVGGGGGWGARRRPVRPATALHCTALAPGGAARQADDPLDAN